MICRRLVKGDGFINNTMNRSLYISGSDIALTCSIHNVVYLQ